MNHPPPKCPPATLVLLGPTCSGKTSVSLHLAQETHAEIISCDSMQVYRGMDIGTAKATPQERSLVRHHLVDAMDIDQRYDANQFVLRSKQILSNLDAVGTPVIITGGTGLYARSLVYDLKLLPANREVFKQICLDYESPNGPEALFSEIAVHSNEAAQRLAKNPRHLMRAVEVLRLTGTLPPQILQSKDQLTPQKRFKQVILMPEPTFHRERIRQRTQEMLTNGWVEETRRLMSAGLLQTPTARQALGYREIAAYLESPKPDLGQLTETIFHRTVQYARRQRTWFRHQHPGAKFLTVERDDTCASLASRVYALIDSAPGSAPFCNGF
jgi:tRNA dimethylallyltransferase